MKSLLDIHDLTVLKRAVSNLVRYESVNQSKNWDDYWRGSASDDVVNSRAKYFPERCDQQRAELLALLAEFWYTSEGRPSDAPPARRSFHSLSDLKHLKESIATLLAYAKKSLEWCQRTGNEWSKSADRRWGEYARLRDERYRAVTKLLEEFGLIRFYKESE